MERDDRFVTGFRTRDAMPCRILIEPAPRRGSWNMAVDEVLLEAALERGECRLRIYQWEAATLSLGYFQEESAGFTPALAALPKVRRLTGGGAILHHHEWTYSCAVPADHPLAREPHALYERVHEQIISTLRRRGVAARRRGADHPRSNAGFLCFGRGDPRDILCGEWKIVGSAQRRRRGAVLQHGSLLLARSPHAAAFPGILDLNAGLTLETEFAAELAGEMARVLADRETRENLNDAERARAEVLEREKYVRLDWQRRVGGASGRESSTAGRADSAGNRTGAAPEKMR